MIAFIAIVVIGFSLGHLLAILVGKIPMGGDIAGQLMEKSRFVKADNFSDFIV